MNRLSKMPAGVSLAVLVVLGSAPQMAPAQSYFLPGEPGDPAPFAGELQEWRNKLGTTDCSGECPGADSSCCPATLMPI